MSEALRKPRTKGQKMLNVLIICSTFSLLVLVSYFLNVGKIGSFAFTVLFISTILASLALYGFDRLKELDLKNYRIILTEISKVKEDIFAKVDTVKKLGEEVAELTAYNVTRIGRLAPDNLDEEMLAARNKIKKILSEIGSDEKMVVKICTPIEDMVLFDLKRNIYHATEQATHDMMDKGMKINREAILSKTESLLERYNKHAIIEYMKEQNIYKDEMLSMFDRVDEFIKNKNLK